MVALGNISFYLSVYNSDVAMTGRSSVRRPSSAAGVRGGGPEVPRRSETYNKTRVASGNRVRSSATVVLAIWLATTASAFGQSQPLSVEIGPVPPGIKNEQVFVIPTRVRNKSRADVHLQISECSYPSQWRSEIPAVRLHANICTEGPPIDILLKPGETLERSFGISISVPRELPTPSKVTFRLGFVPRNSPHTDSSAAIWSNRVTITVTQ
jgi:hypothetical protein